MRGSKAVKKRRRRKSAEKKSGKLYLRVDDNIDNELMESIICMLKFFGGNTPVCLYNESQKKIKVLERDCWVSLNDTRD